MKATRLVRSEKVGVLKAAVCALFLGLGLTAGGQEDQVVLRTPEELDALLAPIALYPDPLLGVILPAATAPADIVMAARYNQAGGDPAQLDTQPWDDSVRTLAHYPELVQWLSDNLEWTRAVGEAFRNQPADVMAAMQRLRQQAQAAGNLVNTPEQRVVNQQDVISIVPTDPDVLYAPQYDPGVVYVTPAVYSSPWISFGWCWRVGHWHRYACDWRGHGVWVHEQHPLWRQPVEVAHAWHPAPVAARSAIPAFGPTAMPRAPIAGGNSHPFTQVQPFTAPRSAPALTQPVHQVAPFAGGWQHHGEPASVVAGSRHDGVMLPQRSFSPREVEHHELNVRASPSPASHGNSATSGWLQPGRGLLAPVSAPAYQPPVQAPANANPATWRPIRRDLSVSLPRPLPSAGYTAAAHPEAPRVMRAAPPAQAEGRAAYHASAPAVAPAPRPGPGNSGNQFNGGLNGSDRGMGGRWGNMARGN